MLRLTDGAVVFTEEVEGEYRNASASRRREELPDTLAFVFAAEEANALAVVVSFPVVVSKRKQDSIVSRRSLARLALHVRK